MLAQDQCWLISKGHLTIPQLSGAQTAQKKSKALNDVWVSGWSRRGRDWMVGSCKSQWRRQDKRCQERDRQCMRLPTWHNVTDERWQCDHDSFKRETGKDREGWKKQQKWKCALKRQSSQIGSALVLGEKWNPHCRLGVSALNPVAKIV